MLAQLILFFIGILTIFIAAFGIRDAHEEVVEIFDVAPAQVEPGAGGTVTDAQDEPRQELIRSIRIAHGIALSVGAIFVACALLVHRMPVAATVTGLGLYVAFLAALVLIEPALITEGLVLRICIVLALSAAVRSAIRSKRRRASSRRGHEVEV